MAPMPAAGHADAALRRIGVSGGKPRSNWNFANEFVSSHLSSAWWPAGF
jgi:hypothetical protein